MACTPLKIKDPQDPTQEKTIYVNFAGTRFEKEKGCEDGVSLGLNLEAGILRGDRTITLTAVDGETTTYRTNAFANDFDRITGYAAVRGGFDWDIPVKKTGFRLEFRPGGVSVESGKFAVDPNDGEGFDPNIPLERELHQLTSTKLFYSASLSAGWMIPKLLLPVGLSVSLDVGGQELHNPKANGFFAVGSFGDYSANWNSQKAQGVARFGVAAKVGFVNVGVSLDSPVDQKNSMSGYEPFEAGGERYATHGTYGESNAPFNVQRDSPSPKLMLTLDAFGLVKWLDGVIRNSNL